MIHELKTWPGPFQAVLDGTKRHEIRVNDRNYQIGDVLWLREWAEPNDPRHDLREFPGYLGRELHVRVTYITAGGQWGLPRNLCVMSIEPTTAAGGEVPR
jgi:hypothetical protein